MANKADGIDGNALNALNLGGYAATDYPRHYGLITDIEVLNNPAYPQSYEGLVDAQKIGIPGITTEWWGLIRYSKNAYPDGHGMQEFIAFDNTLWRRTSVGMNWSTWARNATATPPTVYDLPLVAEVTARTHCSYCKDQFGHVEVRIGIDCYGLACNPLIIARLPEGYRAARSSHDTLVGVATTGARVPVAIDIGDNGALYAWSDLPLNIMVGTIEFNVS